MTTRTMPSLDDWLTTGEVAELYPGITMHDVQRAIKKGLIQAQQMGGYFYLVWKPSLPDIWPVKKAS